MDKATGTLLVMFGALVIAALVFTSLMGGMMWPGLTGGEHMPHWWGWGMGIGIGGLAMLAFWGAVIVGVVVLVRALGSKPSQRDALSPMDVVKQRYAKGEITREQYEQMRKDLDDT